MKGATQAAQRLKQLFRALRADLGKVTRPAVGDPVGQLILGILTRDAPESKARDALERLRSMVVDYNELRVIPALELTEHVGDYPDARTKCEDIARALNRIFAIEHCVALDRLAQMPRKDADAYLARLDGLEAYTRARIKLIGLQIHAIPLDEAMWAYARQQGVVDAACALDEAQGFLQRQIDEDDALEFVALLKKQAWAEMGAAVRKGEVARIQSVPPDRTSRNMLQQIASGSLHTRDDEEEIDLPDELAGGDGFEAEDGHAPAERKPAKSRARPAKSAKAAAKPTQRPAAPAGKAAARSAARPRKAGAS